MPIITAVTSTELRSMLLSWSDYKRDFQPGHVKSGLLLFPAHFKLGSKSVSGLLFKSDNKTNYALIALDLMKCGIFELLNDKATTKYGALSLTGYNQSDLRTVSVRLSMFEPVFKRLTSSIKWLKSGSDIVTFDPDLYTVLRYWLINKVTDKELLTVRNKMNTLYHNDGASPMSDQQFDRLDEMLKLHKINTTEVGATVPTRDKVPLPMPMGSQEKIKPKDNTLTKWLKSAGTSKVVKLLKYDGCSILLHYKGRKIVDAYTRGDGRNGRLVTHQIRTLDIPLNIKDPTELYIRAEVIMPKPIFTKHYKDTNPNSRNLVPGLLNRKEPIDAKTASHIHVIAFEIMNWQDQDKLTQLYYLGQLGFQVAQHTAHDAGKLTDKGLEADITRYKKEGDYEIDGLVLSVNNAKIRNKLGMETNSLNPRYERAFKSDADETLATTVRAVMWKASKDGFLKPRVMVDPVLLDGSTVTYASGFNARFINKNKININSVITICRSGGVIPDIQEIIKPSKIPAVPDPKVFGPYVLNESGVDYVLTGQSDDVDIRRLTHFFETMEVFGVSEATIRKLHAAGYQSIADILRMKASDFNKVEGFQKVSADKTYAAIHKAMQNCTMPQLMDASGCFGRSLGTTKMGILWAEFGASLITDIKAHWAQTISGVHGFADNTADAAAKGLPLFRAFYKQVEPFIKFKPTVKKKAGQFSGQIMVATGFRDKELFARIESEGGTVADSMSKATTLLITKDSTPSLKTEKANKLGIKVISLPQFIKQYNM